MACLNLSNGDFAAVNFSTANANVGNITITRTPTQIIVEHANFSNALVETGKWESVVFGNNNFVALLRFIDGAPGSSQRTIFIVDFTVGGNTPGLEEVHDQGNQLDSTARPQLFLSPANQSLIFTWSSDGQPNQIQRLAISRSDNGGLVLGGPTSVIGLNGTVGAKITATELQMIHPNTGFSDQTTGPRPAGSCDVDTTTPVDFGEAVLGASNAALATVTKTVTLKNTGLDCLDITNIADNAPFALTAASRALLPVTLDPGDDVDFDIVFSPTAPNNNITRSLAITRNPQNGDDHIDCKGKARNATTSISTSTNTLPFGTLVIPPGTDTKSFTVTNNGEINLTITIGAAPAGSDFGWTPIPAPGLALAVGATTAARNVTFTTTTDGSSTAQAITVTPSAGTPRTINCTGAGCIPNALITVPAAQPTPYGQIERGFRTVRFIEITNTGDDDLTFTAHIGPGVDPAQAANFGLVLPENDITDAPAARNYSVLPPTRCGAGPTGNNVQPVAVSFFADGASGVYGANLIIDTHNATNFPAGQSWTFPLTAEIIDPVPVDIALVIDRSGSMSDPLGTRNKMEAALTGAKLLVQMLRDNADDRCAIVGFSDLPVAHQHIVLAGPNRAALLTTLGPPTIAPGGSTNIAGGMIVGSDELATAHPSAPPVLKKAMVVLTDGQENRCFQIGGAGPWFSITGRDANQDMAQPNGTPQDTDVLAAPAGVKVYAIGLGAPNQIDTTALTGISVTTGGSYQGAEDLTGKHYFKLEKYFTQIFMETAGLAQISDPFYDIMPGEKHPHQFDIRPGDVNAMVVIYDEPGERLPFFIESPKGEILSGGSLPPGFSIRYRSTPTARFVEFFFPHKEPDRYVGLWTAWVVHDGYTCTGDIGGKEGSKDIGTGFLPLKCKKSGTKVGYGIAIGAGSNLTMQPYVDPAVKYVGDPIRLNAEVAEAGLPVKGSTVRVHVESPTGQTYTVALIDDGAHQDGSAGDGDYGGTFNQTYVAGNYQLTFTADGMQGNKPYHRESHRTKPVLDPRKPPGDGGGGGGGDDCCRKLIRILTRQEKLLEALLKAKH